MQPSVLTVGSANAVATTGMSWKWCQRFAEARGVRVLRVGERKRLIDAAQLLEAMRAADAEHEATLDADDATIANEMRAKLRAV